MTGTSETLHLSAGKLSLVLAPTAGGCIVSYRTQANGGVDLMRPHDPAAIAARNPRGLACYPLFPFSNRIANGRFSFDGKAHQLALNFDNSPHAIHGNAWQGPWQVAASDKSNAELVFAYTPRGQAGEWPFAYTARQKFTLSEDGLVADIVMTNDDTRTMPCGFGLHPYFPMTKAATLKVNVKGIWESDATLIPFRNVPVPPALDFAKAPVLSGLDCDNCFTGWDHHATITWPEHKTRLNITADKIFGHTVIYVPPHHEFFAFEPVSNANNGFNQLAEGRTDTGVIALAPKASVTGKMSFLPQSH
jgi:aldose 1-epimerase